MENKDKFQVVHNYKNVVYFTGSEKECENFINSDYGLSLVCSIIKFDKNLSYGDLSEVF